MAELSGSARGSLKDSDFAYVEPGHAVNGKTPDKYRHYPIHDKAHVQKALQLTNSPFYAKAKGKIMAAARKHGVHPGDDGEKGRSLESLYPEVRFVNIPPELRFIAGEDRDAPEVRHITGYAAVFDKTSRRLGNFHERVASTAFDEAKAGGWDNVICRYNHDPQMVLGTTGADTCRIDTDERGLQYDVIPPNHRGDVMELVERRDVRASSFAFRCRNEGDDEWGVSKYNMPLRILHNVELVDVAPVMDPAYKDTTAAARSMEGAVFSLARHVQGDPAEVRSMLQAGQVMKFFKRSDRPTVPVLSREAAEERAVVDDIATSLRDFEEMAGQFETRSAEEPEPETRADDDNQNAEERAAHVEKLMAHNKLCKQWTAGEPCVRPAGHADDDGQGGHKPPCWGRKAGIPCHKPMDHDGDHEPMNFVTRDAEGADTPAESPESPESNPFTLEEARAMTDKFTDEFDLSVFDN